ncbi:pectate lyase, partial [Paenibacillus sp. 28ISP30-2]|nr:pectate lyase [Paenibacillus sp. 28ISP30-2]
MRFNVKESVKWIALSGMAITVTTGLINPSWAAAEQDAADAGLNVTQAVYGDTAIYKNSIVPFASASTDSLLDKYRDFSKFSTGDVSKDTKLALNIVSWQLPHGGFFKAMEK